MPQFTKAELIKKSYGLFDKDYIRASQLQKSSSFKEKLLMLFPAGRKFVAGNKALHKQIKSNLGKPEADSLLMKIFGSNKERLKDIDHSAKFDRNAPITYGTGQPYGFRTTGATTQGRDSRHTPMFPHSLSYVDNLKRRTNLEGPTRTSAYGINPQDTNGVPNWRYDDLKDKVLSEAELENLSEAHQHMRHGVLSEDEVIPLIRNKLMDGIAIKQGVNIPVGSQEYRKAMEGALETARNTDKARKLLLLRDLPITVGASSYGINYYLDRRDLNKENKE